MVDHLGHARLRIGDRRRQRGRAREVGDGEVEARVERPVRPVVAGLELGGERAQPRDALRIGALGGELGGRRLHRPAVVERVEQRRAERARGEARPRLRVAGYEVDDIRPAAATAAGLHDSRQLQGPHRLADRGPRDTEPQRQLALRRQPVARRDEPEPDRVAEPLDRLLEDVRGPDRPQEKRVDVAVHCGKNSPMASPFPGIEQ
jgi:hypothetical protein